MNTDYSFPGWSEEVVFVFVFARLRAERRKRALRFIEAPLAKSDKAAVPHFSSWQ